MLDKLKGKKTYLVLALGGIVWFLESIGALPFGSFESAIEPLGLLGGATVAAKFNRLAK